MSGTTLADVKASGKFERKTSVFRNTIEEGSQFPPEGNGRYHLYVSYGCPWACRALVVRSLKGLHDHIPVHSVYPKMGITSKEGEPETKGWIFTEDPFDGIDCSDPLYGLKSMKELYELDTPDYSGRYTVPVLWDSKSKKIVNNESSEIIRFLNFKFNDFAKNPTVNLVPKDKEEEIDKLNTQMYETINNGVYKCGFAQAQEPYNEAFVELFKNLDLFDALLSKSRFLVGSELTEADIRLFVTIIRFDTAYFGIFKCNKKRIEDYPNLRGWVRDVYQYPGIAETVNLTHIKAVYYASTTLNPFGVVPLGPEIDFTTDPGRANKF